MASESARERKENERRKRDRKREVYSDYAKRTNGNKRKENKYRKNFSGKCNGIFLYLREGEEVAFDVGAKGNY